MNETQISKILETAIGGSKTTREAVNRATSQLLGESDLKVGQAVTCIEDDNVVGGYVGMKGKIKSMGGNLSGQVEVELENGTSVWAQSSLLIPL